MQPQLGPLIRLQTQRPNLLRKRVPLPLQIAHLPIQLSNLLIIPRGGNLGLHLLDTSALLFHVREMRLELAFEHLCGFDARFGGGDVALAFGDAFARGGAFVFELVELGLGFADLLTVFDVLRSVLRLANHSTS